MESLLLILVVALVLVAALVGFRGPGRSYVVRRRRPERVLIEDEPAEVVEVRRRRTR